MTQIQRQKILLWFVSHIQWQITKRFFVLFLLQKPLLFLFGPGVPQRLLGLAAQARACVWAFRRGTLPAQPVEVNQVVAHFLDEFHLLIKELVLQEVTEIRVCVGRPRACRSRRAWFRFFSKAMVTPMVSWVLPHSSCMTSVRGGRRHGHCTGFASLRDARNFSANIQKKQLTPSKVTSARSRQKPRER